MIAQLEKCIKFYQPSWAKPTAPAAEKGAMLLHQEKNHAVGCRTKILSGCERPLVWNMLLLHFYRQGSDRRGMKLPEQTDLH